jgi:hypothetical protein
MFIAILSVTVQDASTHGREWTPYIVDTLVDMSGHEWTPVDMNGHEWTPVDTLVDMRGHEWTYMRGHLWTQTDPEK